MTNHVHPVKDAAQQAKQTASAAAENPMVEKLGRFGYAAKGVVYAIVGILAVQAAVGAGGATTGQQGALSAIAAQPLGRLLLVLVAIGLVGYVIWRIVQAVIDTDGKGNEPKGIATRLGYVVSGIAYGGLALAAARLALGSGDSGGGSTASMTARLMEQPFGRWLVTIVGVVVIGVGLYQIYRAYSASFRKHLKLNEMSDTEETWAVRSSRFGLLAHGIVFGITGIFVVQAALNSDPNRAQGLDGALQALAGQPFGPWLLGIVALGLVAYGIHQLVEARYRRMILS